MEVDIIISNKFYSFISVTLIPLTSAAHIVTNRISYFPDDIECSTL